MSDRQIWIQSESPLNRTQGRATISASLAPKLVKESVTAAESRPSRRIVCILLNACDVEVASQGDVLGRALDSQLVGPQVEFVGFRARRRVDWQGPPNTLRRAADESTDYQLDYALVKSEEVVCIDIP